MTIEMCLIAPHVPSIVYEDEVPDFQKQMVMDMKQLSKKIKGIKPDVIVLVSCHWPSTFFHYVDCTPVHKGLLTALEAPDLVKDVPYHYPGDQDLAEELVKAGQTAGLQVQGVNDPHYLWDYGTVLPLRYLVPDEDIPVINLSVTLAASLDETYRWGQEIGEVLKKSQKKIVFVASGALSHNLVRGRHNKPTITEHAMDKQFLEFVMEKDYQAAYDMLPQYARLAKVEAGGRHLALLFSLINQNWSPVYYSHGQSSGSWNVLMTFEETTIASEDIKMESEYA